MVATPISIANVQQLYRVWQPDNPVMREIKQLYSASQLQGVLAPKSTVRILVGEWADREVVIKQIIDGSDQGTLLKLMRDGYSRPEDIIALAPVVNLNEERDAKDCDRIIRTGLRASLEAMIALSEMADRELWRALGYGSMKAYWESVVEELEADYKQVPYGYERLDQLVQAGRTFKALPEAAKPVFEQQGNEAVLRQMRAVSDLVRDEVAEQVAQEVGETGRKLTAPLVEQVEQDIVREVAFDEVRAKFAEHGWEFKHYRPVNRKTAKMRFMGEGPGLTKWWPSLWEADRWCDLHLNRTIERTCLECRHCDAFHEAAGEDDIWCGRKNTLIDMGRVATVGPECPEWRDKKTAPQTAPQTAQERMHDRLQNGGSTEGNDHDENSTPRELWLPALEEWGLKAFTLDPATNEHSSVPAQYKFTKQDDALKRCWAVEPDLLLWMNPPFSMNEEFSHKFVQELEAGHIDEAIVLNKADSRTAWHQRYLTRCQAVCRVFGSVKFEAPNGEKRAGSTFAVDLFYFGKNVDYFYRAYESVGMIMLPCVPELIGE